MANNNNNDPVNGAPISIRSTAVKPTEPVYQRLRAIGSTTVDLLIGENTTVEPDVYAPEEYENVLGEITLGNRAARLRRAIRDRADDVYVAHILPWAQNMKRQIQQYVVRRVQDGLRERVENLV